MTLPPDSLRLGPISLDFPVVQAALSGYSDLPMRVIARRLGAPYALCEVMLDQFLVALRDRKRTRHFLQISDAEHPVGGQLMGAEPEQFAAGAERLVEAGFDVIDINFGCPVQKSAGTVPRWISLESAERGTRHRPANARPCTGGNSGDGQDAPRAG
jgi:tRNA-dihydrouridine synthase B